MTYKTTKTILFASLIAVLVLPFAVTHQVDAEKQIVFSSYEQLLLENTPSLQGMTDKEKIDHVSNLRVYVNSLTGYEAKLFDKLNKLSDSIKNVDESKLNNDSQVVIDKLEKKYNKELFELEDLAVTTQKRYDANPDYWNEKAETVKNKVEKIKTSDVSGIDSTPNLYNVHQTDLALKRTNILTFPCLGFWNNQLSCPQISYGWNAGTSSTSILLVPTDGKITFDSSVCVDSDTHHNSVTFDMQTKRDIHSILQTTLYNYDQTDSTTLIGSSGNCEDSLVKKSINAGSRAGMTTGISSISLN